MAGVKGQRSGGHNRKSTAELKLAGRYREDRHGDRSDESVSNDKLTRPKGLGPYARRVFDLLVDDTPDGIYSSQDVELIRQYAEACEAASEAKKAGDLREWRQMVELSLKISPKLGIGPIDRARLTLPDKESKPADPLSQIKAM